MKFTRFSFDASKTTANRIAKAIDLAALSEMRQRHGAVLYLGGSLIATGINVQRNAVVNYVPYRSISTHAEINCLRGLGTAEGKLYIARLSPSDTIMDSRPCEYCWNYITRYTRIKEVIYT